MEYSRDEMLTALRKADEAGDRSAVVELSSMLEAHDADRQGEAVPEPSSSFGDKIAADVGKRNLELNDLIASLSGLEAQEQATLGTDVAASRRPLYDPENNVAQNVAGSVEGVVQAGGNILGRAADTLGSAITSAGGAVVEQIPPEIQAKISDAAHQVMDTPVGRTIMQGIQSGGALLEHVKKKYPQEYQSVASALEIGAVLTPSKKVGGPIEEFGERSLKAGQNQKRDQLAKLMTPDDRMKPGRDTGESKWLRIREMEPNDFDLAVADAVSGAPKTSGARSATYNRQHTINAAREEGSRLRQEIYRAGDPKFNKDAFMDELGELVDNFKNTDEALVLSGDASSVAEKILWKAYELIDASDGTASGLLTARQQLDRWVEKNAGKAMNVDVISAKNVAQKLVRDRINAKVDELVPSVPVKDSLYKQHLLLTGADDLHLKMATEGKDPLERTMKNISKLHVGPIGGLAILSTLGVGAGGVMGAAVPGLLGGAGLWAIFETATSATRKKILGALIKDVGRTIKNADSTLAGQLKADRLVLMDMLQYESQVATEEAQEQQQQGAPR